MKRLILAACLCSGATRAGAQNAPRWNDITIRPGTLIFVVDTLKREWQGTFDTLTAASLSLRVGAGREQFARNAVVRISRPGDKVWDGFGKGFAFGAIAMLLFGGMSDCPDTDYLCKPGHRWMMVPLGGLVYGLIGMGIDASTKGKTVLYDAQKQ